MLDAKHPMAPFGGEAKNSFKDSAPACPVKGLKCSSNGTGPAQVAVMAIKVALAALQGQVVPREIGGALGDG